jgi:hypothetical protein
MTYTDDSDLPAITDDQLRAALTEIRPYTIVILEAGCFVWHATRAAGVVALPMLSPVITLGVGKSPRAPGGQRRLLFLAARMI